MLRRTRAVAASAIAAAALAAPVPASAVDSAAIAAAPCRGDVGLVWEEWHQTVHVTGVLAPSGAVDVRLTCGIVRYGETVARVSEDVFGPVAVVHDSVRIHAGPIALCYEASVFYLDGNTDYFDTCP